MSDDDDNEQEDPEFVPGEEFSAVRERLIEIERKALQKIRKARFTESNQDRCSFCGKGKDKVSKLLQSGNGATICNECIRAYKNELGDDTDR